MPTCAEATSDDRGGAARVDELHGLTLAMPYVAVYPGTGGNPIHRVGGKSFVFFRSPRPDAVDSFVAAGFGLRRAVRVCPTGRSKVLGSLA